MANAAGRATRERMILVAEEMFAHRGIDVVPLREIGEAADQRNTAVVNYYFGDRDGLVKAIFDFRLEQVEVRRKELLDKVKAAPKPKDGYPIRDLLEALVLPLAEQCEVGHFVGLIARMQTDFGAGVEYVADKYWSGTREVRTLLREHFPALPDATWDSRTSAISLLEVHMLSTWQLFGSASAKGRSSDDLLTELIDICIGILEAASTFAQSRTRRRSPRRG